MWDSTIATCHDFCTDQPLNRQGCLRHILPNAKGLDCIRLICFWCLGRLRIVAIAVKSVIARSFSEEPILILTYGSKLKIDTTKPDKKSSEKLARISLLEPPFPTIPTKPDKHRQINRQSPLKTPEITDKKLAFQDTKFLRSLFLFQYLHRF